jgi:23S rRNA (uracil1939-C5)-methyltransferase
MPRAEQAGPEAEDPRPEPGCPVDCPGCAHRSLSPGESRERKSGWLRRRLAPWSDKLEPIRFLPEGDQAGYRARIGLSAERRGARWCFGLWSRSEDRLIEIPDCPVHAPRIRDLLRALSSDAPGPERFPLVFTQVNGALLTCVLKRRAPTERFDGLSTALVEALRGSGIEGVFLNWNPSAGNRVFSRAWEHVWGGTEASLRIDGESFLYGPSSFLQLLPRLFGAALTEAERHLAASPGASVADLCCGIGTSLRRWLRAGARAFGVELNGEAVAFSRRNAAEALCLQGRVRDRLPQLDEWRRSGTARGPFLVFANPPRTGLESGTLEWLAAGGGPLRLAYLSCSAGTLARDLERLQAGGYRVARLVPFDFFPRTEHVETLALLEGGTFRGHGS